jgi:chemotaxis protein MotB
VSEIQPIIVRRGKKARHRPHGGAWKVAYADFVTAMMAFFLVMWLLGVGTREQKAAVSEYFKNPSNTPGTATIAPPGKIGPGGASDSVILLGGAMDLSRGPGNDKRGAPVAKGDIKLAAEHARQQEKQRLEELMQQLHAAIQSSQALAPFKDQLLIDIMPDGLRIQIVDKLNRTMFDTGSATLKPYTFDILEELGKSINSVPNMISISGHTDDAPYNGSQSGYSNWELSADRGNAARRALISGGLESDKVARVAGMAAEVPFDKKNPSDPTNRRISIIVMTKEAQRAALSQQTAGLPSAAGATPAMPGPIKAPAAAPTAPAVLPAGSVLPRKVAGGTPLPSMPPTIVPAGAAPN